MGRVLFAAAVLLAGAPSAWAKARRAYVEGRDDYFRGDLPGADRRWHDCLSASDQDPASRPDCLMAVELTRGLRDAGTAAVRPRPAPPSTSDEAASSQLYLEGVIDYQKGDYVKARGKWSACAPLNADCRAGVARIDQIEASSTALDGKK